MAPGCTRPAWPPCRIGVVFTGDLAALISYDSAKALLRFNGAMTDATLGHLNGSFDRPIVPERHNRSLPAAARVSSPPSLAFLNSADALANLINSRSPDAAGRYSWVLQTLLAYLTDTQSRSLVQQSLSQALALDSDTTALLLSGGSGSTSPALLKSQRDATQASIVDLLDVRDGGLLATYFSDTALTAVTATRIDATVNVGTRGSDGSQSWRSPLARKSAGGIQRKLHVLRHRKRWRAPLGEQSAR